MLKNVSVLYTEPLLIDVNFRKKAKLINASEK